MAIAGDQPRKVPGRGKDQITVEEFKEWLMKFDSDKDSKISRKELRAAVRSRGGWLCSWKSSRGMNDADLDSSGYIDEDEIEDLLDFAESHLGFKFYF